MKTTFTAVDRIYDVLNASADLKEMITGTLYKFDSRPADANTEDIVVNAITLLDRLIQPGTCNVNIHVHDRQEHGEDALYNVPNTERLALITEKAKEVLGNDKGCYQSDGNFWISNISGPLKQPDMNEHYVNLRIQMEFHNQTYS